MNEKVVYETNNLFIAIGQVPQNEFLKDLVTLDHGFIVTNEVMETAIPGLYAAGDTRLKENKQVITACNDGAVAAVFDEFDACVDLWAHRAFEKVAAGREFLDFIEADLFDVFLVGFSVVEFGVIDVGEDEEDVGFDEFGEFCAGEVFVDDGCGAVEAVFVANDGDAAAA